MKAISKMLAAISTAAVLGGVGYIALTPGPADAGYGVTLELQARSNAPSKTDQAEARNYALPKAMEVAEIRHEGKGFVLIDADGREVYRSDPARHTTTVAENAEIPLLTGLGVATSQAAAAPITD